MPQMTVTSQPAVEKLPMISLKRVPVVEKNVPKTCTCMTKATAVMASMSRVSTALSVTTVPNAFGNDTLS